MKWVQVRVADGYCWALGQLNDRNKYVTITDKDYPHDTVPEGWYYIFVGDEGDPYTPELKYEGTLEEAKALAALMLDAHLQKGGEPS